MALPRLDNNAIIESSTEMRDFARVLRRALLMIVKYLETRYRLCD
jgi:hypothetical protein